MQHVRSWRRRAVSFLLAAVMVLGFFPALPGGEAGAHWADDYLAQMIEWGLIRADQADSPNQPLTRADFMSIVNRAYGYHEVGPTPFEDVSEYDWFYDDVGIAYTAKYIQGTSETTASPNDTLDRETAATILGRNMMLQDSPGEIMDFADARQISNWSRGTIKASLEHYLVSGYDDGTFRPQRSVTWGEMAALMSRTIGTPIQEEGDYTLGGVFGNVTISSPGVTLRDTVISGDLYVTGGVGLGNIKLENVTVLGRIIASGTGESEGGRASILMRNVSADELLVDNLQDNYVTIQADGITEIGKTTVRTSAYIEDNTPEGLGLKYIELNGDEGIQLDLAGRVEEVVNKTPGSLIQAAKGTVAKLTVDEDAINATLDVNRGAEVKELNLDVATNVTGQGDVEKLNVNAPGSIVTMLPDEIQIRPGITAVINGQEMDSTGAEESTRDPLILSGYPMAADVAPNSISAVFATNKRGTVHWAVSAITDGSVGVDDLIKPPVYGSIAVQRGSVLVPQGDEEVSAAVTGLLSGGSYYLSAVLVDERGNQSPLKVIAFTTPDDTVPAFNQGYPHMSKTSRTNSLAVVMANKDCVMYYALMPQGAQAPTPDELRTARVPGNLGYGVRTLTKNTEDVFQVNDRTLEEQETYIVYFWLTDANGANSSAVTSLTFTTADETPPTFITKPTVTNVQANSVGLTFRLSENGVVFWAVVEEGAAYPKPEPGQTGTAPLDSDYAKLQVSSGLNALVSGRVNANEAADGTINVTGLQPETSYDLYYVAQDAAGNYSVTVEKITINTLDTNGPKISQRFSKYSGLDDTMNPMPDTDIILEFSENVCSTGTVGQDFLALYQATLSSADKEQAIKNLRDALAYSITLYQQSTGQFQPVKVRTYPYVATETDWVIDFAQAKVESRDGKVLLTFPNSALNLNGGGVYYFTISNLTDNSTRKNPIVPSTVDYNQASTAQGHNVPMFTVVFAQVALTPDNALSQEEYPYKIIGEGETAENVYVDFSFFMIPRSTSTAANNIQHDLIFWSETSIAFDLYYRAVDANRNVITDNNLVPSSIGTKEKRQNGWIYLGNSGQLYAATDEERGAVDLHKQFNGCSAATFPKLRELKDSSVEGGPVYYEFAVSLTRVGTISSRPAWTDDVNLYVNVAASTGQPLENLANRSTESYWDTFKRNGLGNNGGVSIGVADDGSDTLKMQTSFSNTQVPHFTSGAPVFEAGDSSVTIRVNMDLPGTVYYLIAPVPPEQGSTSAISFIRTTVENPKYDASDPTKGPETLSDRELFESNLVPGSGDHNDYNVDNTGHTTSGTYTESKWVSTPIKDDVIAPPYNNSQYKSGSYPYSGGQGYEPIPVVTGLMPNQDYFAYFVLRGASREMSQVYLYTFKTDETAKPKLALSDMQNGVVRIQATNRIESDVKWRVFPQLEGSEHNYLTDKIILPDDVTGYGTENATTNKREITVLEALTTSYNAATAYGTSNLTGVTYGTAYNDFSVFDVFASPTQRSHMEELVRESFTSLTTINQDECSLTPGENYMSMEDWYTNGNGVRPEPATYLFIAVAHNVNSQSTDGNWAYVDSFRAWSDTVYKDANPPVLDRTNTTITKSGTGTSATYSGTVTLTFDKAVYWSPNGSSVRYSVQPQNGAPGKTTVTGSNPAEQVDTVGILYGALGLPTTGFTSEGTAGTTPSDVFSFSFTGVPQSTITLLPNGNIRAYSGNPVENGQYITITITEGPHGTGVLGNLDGPYVRVEFNGKVFIADQLQA